MKSHIQLSESCTVVVYTIIIVSGSRYIPYNRLLSCYRRMDEFQPPPPHHHDGMPNIPQCSCENSRTDYDATQRRRRRRRRLAAVEARTSRSPVSCAGAVCVQIFACPTLMSAHKARCDIVSPHSIALVRAMYIRYKRYCDSTLHSDIIDTRPNMRSDSTETQHLVLQEHTILRCYNIQTDTR